MLKRTQIWAIILAATFVPFQLLASAQGPRIAFSDLLSGPSSGGEGNQGAIVTLTGSGFGASQGKSQILLADTPVRRVLVWNERKIALQIGADAKSGEIRVVSDRGKSNAVPFRIGEGRIHFVSTAGHDGGNGSWASPWRTIPHAVSSMRPGDITYVLDGVRQSVMDNYNAAVSIQSAGTLQKPIALVAYPGANAAIGDVAGPEFGARTPAIHGGPFDNWIIAGFTIRGANTALRLHNVSGWRIVNNDFACPNGDGAAGCVDVSDSSEVAFLGNSVHNSGRSGASKKYQSVYFTTDSNHIEVGWNHIFQNHSCRGLQFHSSPLSADSGFNQYDILIHDNEISDQVCDGINLATIDPSKGRIAVYNNVISHVGVGPMPHDGDSSYVCINSPGIVNRGSAGSGTVEIANNTLSDCGSNGGPSAGAFSVGSSSPDLLLRNNIIAQRGEPYFTSASSLSKVHGDANLWWGAGASPKNTSGNLASDPRFSSGSPHFMLSSQSPAKHASRDCTVDYDLAGSVRSRTAGCSLGAYE